MNRKNNSIKKIFQRMHKMGKKVAEIGQILVLKGKLFTNGKNR